MEGIYTIASHLVFIVFTILPLVKGEFKMSSKPKMQSEEIANEKVHAALDSEKWILGSLMIGNAESEEVFDAIRPEMFFMPRHTRIFQAILDLREAKSTYQLPDVYEQTIQSGYTDADPAYLASLFDGLPEVHSLEVYIKAIQRAYRMRKYVRFAYSLNEMLQTPGVQEGAFLQAARDGAAKLVAEFDFSTDLGDTFFDSGVNLFMSLDRDNPLRIETGIRELDRMTGGFHPGELVVLTADTGVGKTILAQQCRRMACSRGWHTLYCSGEMLAHHLIAREVSADAGVPQWKMRDPKKITPDERVEILQVSSHLCKQCRVLDKELTLAHIGSAARGIKRKTGLELVVIDYDELIEVQGKDEWEQQKNLARAAKSLAMELNCAVILISQLRKPLQGEDRAKPRIQSLYGSSAKAKHASIVIYVDRQFVRDLEGDETEASIFVLKSRDGRVGKVDCRFNVHTLRFEEKEGANAKLEF
jgi:replicative DNA helicase